MEHPENLNDPTKTTMNRIIDGLIRLTALSLLFFWCFKILEPFITLLLWASVLAISLHPAFKKIRKRFGGRNIPAAAILSILLLAILIAPAVWLLISSGGGLKDLVNQLQSGNITIPPPSESVKGYAIIGKPLYDMWSLASTNLAQLVQQYRDQLSVVAEKMIELVASTGKGLLLFALSIIVSGVLLVYGEKAGNFARTFFVRLAGTRGEDMASVAAITVRNVIRGILGVAFIQSLMAGIGMFVAGVPFAGLWTLLCLILAIVQIGILPVSLGVIIYAWTSLSTLTAILITVWMGIVGIMDNILKPILLGRKAPVPMLIVFLGAIGGFIYYGFIGLFTGAIILSLGYKLFIVWIDQKEMMD